MYFLSAFLNLLTIRYKDFSLFKEQKLKDLSMSHTNCYIKCLGFNQQYFFTLYELLALISNNLVKTN